MRRWRGFVTLCALAVLAALAAMLALALFWPAEVPDYASVRAGYVPSDAWLLDRHGAVLDTRRVRMDVRRLEWVPLKDISPAFLGALLEGEDRHFYQHHGVDWASTLGALRDETLRHRRRGASTITMQLASLLQHRRRGAGVEGVLEKLAQIRAARALEAHWSKPQILEAYVNLLGYRGELQGIGAAAASLAGKTPAGLSLSESLVLAAFLPQPQADRARVLARGCARARQLSAGADCAALAAAADALFAAPHELPAAHLAPHLARALLRKPGERVTTTLDATLQRRAREILESHLASLAARNVRDGAVLVVDNDSGAVLAYVAAASLTSRSGQVDGVLARRQAGSTLKPFLYEMALERRYLTAASLLADAPLTLDTASGLYIPQDYDHDFKGLVSVRTALAGSLNVPAVRTLALVGVEPFRNRLHELGYSYIKEDGEFYGYSLALGSAEVTLWQQAQAYRVLSRGGVWSPLTVTPVPAPDVRDLLSEDATFVIGDILSDPAARAVTFGLDNHLHTPFWSAVKTGTSEDMRDNWCVGFSSRYTVAVWVGNFEGDSMHEVSGVTGAAPVWHDLMVLIHQSTPSIERAAPAGVTSQLTRFAPAVEPARREWFLSGADLPQRESAAVPDAVLPKIESPADGLVVALDPDIPPERQRILISVRGASDTMHLKLNGAELGPATHERFWAPRAGVYHLSLEDGERAVSRVVFTVRGAAAD